MRDVLIMSIVLLGALAALRRPWIGVMLWTWVSLMNPHRMAYGFAYDMPVAAIAAGSTLLGLLVTKERDSPFKGTPSIILALFMIWITLSLLAGLDPAGDYQQWNKVMKIYLMTMVALMLLRTKEHIIAFAWVITGSLALIGAKGGIFTIATAGAYRVWGPPDTFIAENNAFAVAIIMTIPLVRFLQLQLSTRWGRLGLTVVMVLMATCALGSQSRGALLALVAMTALMWWRQKRHRLVGALLVLTVGATLLVFMPDSWQTRMSTIKTYESDLSAMGRIAAWWVAWGIGFDYPLGVGFFAARPELFAKYCPYIDLLAGHFPVAHSIYFQMLGHHGFVGLGLFLTLWLTTWRIASRVRAQCKDIPQAQWCSDLCAMVQVSLVGYAVGGAFLDIGYFDLPYNLMVLAVLTSVWLRTKAWEREAPPGEGRWVLPGLRPHASKVSPA